MDTPSMALGRLKSPRYPLGGGGWTLDFWTSPRYPPGGGGWTLDFLRSPTPPPGGGGWTLDFLGCPRDPLRRPQPTSKSLRIMAKTQNFARSLRSRGSPWVQEGGVGPWTFWEVQGTLQEGAGGPWTLWEVKGTLQEGGVGPWTSQNLVTLS